MKVAIRTDASLAIGSGHVMRCKTLADELCRRGAEICFICRDHPGNLIPLLRNAGHSVVVLPAPQSTTTQAAQGYTAWLGVAQVEDAVQTVDALNDFEPDWLVVDHYALDATWESRFRPHAKRILAIDDLANRPHDCDLLLDQNWIGGDTEHRYDSLVPEKCHCLLGPRYALLQPVFGQLRKCLPQRQGNIRRTLVFFGGVDSGNQTAKVLRALSLPEFSGITADIVIGNANPHGPEIESLVAAHTDAVLHRQLPGLAGLMARADLMLCAGGSTTWERCCLSLPSIVVMTAENQQRITAALADARVQHSLGMAADVKVDDWIAAVRKLRRNPAQVQSYAVAASRVTDGLGVYRVASVMGGRPISIRVRRATREDESLLLEWANDPDVRRNAFSPAPISPENHHEWFHRKLADPNCLLVIGQDLHGMPVGQVRFDCHENEALIDVSIDRMLRGQGLGQELLNLALDVLRSEGRKERPVAEVLKENQASRHLFLHLGFQAVPPVSGRVNCDRFVLAG